MFITVCHLTLHDYLFYASREMGRLYETEKYLHNYGLTYALGLAASPYSNLAQVPRYQEDLDGMNKQGVYVTPAYPLRYTFSFSTFKMANVNYYNFTPQISSNQVVFGRSKELAPESTFEFFVQGGKEIALPRWIRLGKWMAKARVDIKAQGVAQTRQGSFRADGALNPLDLSLLPESCNIVAMAPASLITNVFSTGSYYEFDYDEGGRKRTIRLPMEMSYRPGRNARLFA
jgi:CRISPR-associated protein Csc1